MRRQEATHICFFFLGQHFHHVHNKWDAMKVEPSLNTTNTVGGVVLFVGKKAAAWIFYQNENVL